jgi:hypothetical protein
VTYRSRCSPNRRRAGESKPDTALRRHSLTGPFACLLVTALVALSSCGGEWTVRGHHSNGQLCLLEGESDWRGLREGLWVYYDENGKELFESKRHDGSLLTLTGIYKGGARIGLPTDEQLKEARERADARRAPRPGDPAADR